MNRQSPSSTKSTLRLLFEVLSHLTYLPAVLVLAYGGLLYLKQEIMILLLIRAVKVGDTPIDAVELRHVWLLGTMFICSLIIVITLSRTLIAKLRNPSTFNYRLFILKTNTFLLVFTCVFGITFEYNNVYLTFLAAVAALHAESYPRTTGKQIIEQGIKEISNKDK